MVIDGACRLVSRLFVIDFAVTELLDQVLTIAKIVVTFGLVKIVTMGYLGPLYFSTCVLPSLPSISNFLISRFFSQVLLHNDLEVITLLIMPIILSFRMFRG